MACIHYKFKNSLDFDSITFDGLHISVRDLKEAIMQRKKLNDTDMDLLIINALNAKAYKDEDEMIPKNASVIVARIPLSDAPRSKGPKTLNAYKEDPKPQPQVQMPNPIVNKDNLAEVADLVSAVGSEEDKIKAMMKQSTKDFDPANYQKKLPTGTPSPSYVCFKCNRTGHFIHNCPNVAATTDASGSPKTEEGTRMKRPTGIPHTFLTTANRSEPGAMSLGDGRYAVPTIDQQAFKKGKKERPPFLPAPVEEKKDDVEVPSELTCLLCKDLLTDAVVIPCCGNSYCDECIRNHLIEDEDHKCPTCHEENVSPDKLIINKSLRVSVNNFKNETLYQKRENKSSSSPPPPPPPKTSSLTTTSVPKTTSGTTVTAVPKTTAAVTVTSAPLKLDTSMKTIDLTSDPEPETPVLDEKKEPEEKGKGIAVLSGRQAITTTSQEAAKTTTSYRPAESKPVISTESYVPPVPIPSIGGGYPPHIPPASLPNTALPPPGYRPLLYHPNVVPPPFGVPPGFIPPQVASKPLSEHEFYREKKRLLCKANPLDDYTRPSSERDQKKKSKSKSPRRRRTNSPRSRSRSRSRTPKAGSRDKKSSRTPPPKKRSYTKSRSRSPYRKKKSYSRSRSRSITPRLRSRSPRLRTRSLTPRTRSRSRSWTPKKFRGRSRSFTRSRTRSRSRSRTPRPRRRMYSRSPPPRRRSFSRSLTPRRRSYSRSPQRRRSRSPYYRGRSRSPGFNGYGRDWSPPPYRGYRSPPTRAYSPPRYGGPQSYNYGGRNEYPARFDQRIYEEIFQDYIARFGLPPPPPPGQSERGMYFDPRKGVYRGGSKSPKSSRRDRNKDRKDDKHSRNKDKDKKTSDKSTKSDDKSSRSKSKKDDAKTKGKEDKSKEKENKAKDKKPEEKTDAKIEKSKEAEVKAPGKKTVKKVKLKDGTVVKKESIALRLKTKTTAGKHPVKAGKPDPTKKPLKETDRSDTQLNAINRSGALKTIATSEDVGKVPQKENVYSKSKKNSNLIEINTQHVLPDIKNIPKDDEKGKGEQTEHVPMETSQKDTEKSNVPENTDMEQGKDDNKKDVDSVKKEIKKDPLKKVKVVKKVKKVKKLVDVDASQSDSASDLDKVKSRKKKRVEEINENNENSQDESPAKRLKQESEDDILNELVKSEDQLMLSPPELSKWERDDYNEDKSPDLREKLKKKAEKKPSLPRSIIESAEKAITQKQPKPATVASAIVPAPPSKKLSVHDRLQKSPVRQIDERSKKSPIRNDPKSPIRQQRRVYMDDKTEEENRKVQSRESSMQITISSDKNKSEKDSEKKSDRSQRRVSETDKHDRRRTSESDKTDKRKVLENENRKNSVDEKHDKISKNKTSEKEKQTSVREKDHKTQNALKEKKSESKSKSNDTDVSKHEKAETKKPVNGQDEDKSKQEDEMEKEIVKKKKYERKESIIDESSFVPDYNEHSDSDAGSDAEGSSASHAEEADEKSDKDEKKHKKQKKEKKHKKNKKHKHKHKKKKHKKHKEESADKNE